MQRKVKEMKERERKWVNVGKSLKVLIVEVSVHKRKCQ